MSEKRVSDVDLGAEVSLALLARIFGALFGFVGTIVFARVLGPSDYGGFGALVGLVALTRRPISGVMSATTKRYSEEGSARQELIGTQLLATAIVGIAVAAVVIPLAPYLQSYTGIVGSEWLFLLLIVTLPSFGGFQSFLTAIGRVGVQSWIDSVRSITTLIGQIMFVSLGCGAAGMVYGLSLGTAMLIPITHYYLRTYPTWPSLTTVVSVWRFARYKIPSAFLSKAYDRFDILILVWLAGSSIGGQYEVAYKITIPATFIAGAAGAGLMAKVSEAESRGQDSIAGISESAAFAGLFAVPILFGSLAIPQAVVVTLFGASYKEAAPFLIGLAAYRVVQSQSEILVNVASGLDLPEADFRTVAAALPVNIVLGLALFTVIGPVGIVISTVAAELVRYVLLRQFILKRINVTLLPRTVAAQFAAGGIMFLVVDLVDQIVSITSWIDLAPLLMLGGVVYFVILAALSSLFRTRVMNVLNQLVTTYRP